MCSQIDFNSYVLVRADICTWKNERLRLYICKVLSSVQWFWKSNFHICSAPESVDACLFDVFRAAAQMPQSQLCWTSSYWLFSEYRKNTMCTTSKISVCSTWRRKVRKDSKVAAVSLHFSTFSCPTLAQGQLRSPIATEPSVSSKIHGTPHTFQFWASQKSGNLIL